MVRAGQKLNVQTAFHCDPFEVVNGKIIVVFRCLDGGGRQIIDLQKVVKVRPKVVVIAVQHTVGQSNPIARRKFAENGRVDCSL